MSLFDEMHFRNLFLPRVRACVCLGFFLQLGVGRCWDSRVGRDAAAAADALAAAASRSEGCTCVFVFGCVCVLDVFLTVRRCTGNGHTCFATCACAPWSVLTCRAHTYRVK